MMKRSAISAAIVISFFSLAVSGQDGNAILRKTDEVIYAPKDQTADLRLVMIDSRGNEQVREAHYTQKGNNMRLFRFTSPASQDGIAFLSLPDDVMYLYLPAYQKERRIATHIKNQSFAGTDFSYDDMESRPLADEYDATLKDQDSESWILELIPKDQEGSDYARLVVTVSKSNYYFRQVDYYNASGIRVKTLVNTKVMQINGYWTATEIQMTDHSRQHSTKMISSGTKFDSGLTDEDFTVRKMKQF
jgi:outer membrane lipoprotein-sorting protein